MVVEHIKLNGAVPAGDRIRQPVRVGGLHPALSDQPVEPFGDFEAAILGEQNGLAHTAACSRP